MSAERHLHAVPSTKTATEEAPVEERVSLVVRALTGYSAVVGSEEELSKAVRGLFESAGFDYQAEVRLRTRDRIDFIVRRVGVELKTDGSTANLIRQLDRYASHPDLDALVVVTTRRRLAMLPSKLRGKRIVAVVMGAL